MMIHKLGVHDDPISTFNQSMMKTKEKKPTPKKPTPKKTPPKPPGSIPIGQEQQMERPPEEITEVPFPESIPIGDTKPGCIRCSGNPKAKGDLSGQFAAGSPLLLAPCSDQWKEVIQYRIDWKNSDGRNVGYNEKYKKQAGDTTAYKAIETFDELIDIIQQATGAAVTLPQVLTAGGVRQVDNIVRDLTDKVSIFLKGKKDMEILRGEVEWDFELREKSTVTIFHTHLIEGFAQRPGIWDFKTEVAVEDNISQLTVPKDADRAKLINKDFKETGGLSLSTDGKKFYKANHSIQLFGGKHSITTMYTLNAGYGGIIDESVEKSIDKAVKDVKAAIQTLIDAAGKILNPPSGSGNQTTDALKKALEAAATAAGSVLGVLLGIFQKLLERAIGYIKLYRSTLRLTCSKPGPQG